MPNPTEHPTLDEILMGVRHSGYNRHVLELDPKDEGFDQYKYALTSEEAKAALSTLIAREIIGDNEYYHEHYPFVRTTKQQEEVEEKIARDELRTEQRKALTAILGGSNE